MLIGFLISFFGISLAFGAIWAVWMILRFAAINDGHSTGGKGWYSTISPLTPEERQRAENDQEEGLAAALASGLIADGLMETLVQNPGVRVYLDETAWNEWNGQNNG